VHVALKASALMQKLLQSRLCDVLYKLVGNLTLMGALWCWFLLILLYFCVCVHMHVDFSVTCFTSLRHEFHYFHRICWNILIWI